MFLYINSALNQKKEYKEIPPEGIHKDGHTFISMHMIGRHNIRGGTSYIYDENRKK